MAAVLFPRPPPTPRVDPDALPTVLNPQLYGSVLLPFIGHASAARPPPRWTAELEMWYAAVHEEAWGILAADDDDDHAYVSEMKEVLAQQRELVSLGRAKSMPSEVQVHYWINEVYRRIYLRGQRIFVWPLPTPPPYEEAEGKQALHMLVSSGFQIPHCRV
ncbi:hypothetical protein JCM10207_008092 [Rhodosporidiobolus poonsookiae]